MKGVFIDTSALLPLLDRDDDDHGLVVAAVEALTRKQVPLYTTSYVQVEAGALVKRRLGSTAFAELGKALEGTVETIWVDEALHRQAWVRAAEEPRKGPGLVDWTSFLTMQDLGLDTALTLDSHFEKQGFNIVPPSIP